MQFNHSLQQILLLAILLISIKSQQSPTKWTDPNTNTRFDFSALVRSPDHPWEVVEDNSDSYYTMKYYINFGVPHNKVCRDQKPAVSEVLMISEEDSNTCEILGKTENQEVSLIDESDIRKGIKVTYGGGDSCNSMESYYYNTEPRKTILRIYCAKKQSKTFVVDLPGGVQGSTKCTMEFKIESPAGCPGGYYSMFTSPFILLIIVLLFSAYIGIGMFYNQKFKEKAGKEAIPNIEFWREFPEYVKLGLKVTFGWIGNTVNFFKSKFMKGSNSDNNNYTDI